MVLSKNLHIETLRGIAIILIIYNHSMWHSEAYENAFILWIYNTFNYLQTPLFAAISGFIYALRPVQLGNYSQFFKAKIKRLMIPCYVGTFIFWFAQQIVSPDSQLDFFSWKFFEIFYVPWYHFWFIYALFWIFLIVGCLDTVHLINTSKRWLYVLIFGIVACFFRDGIDLLGLKGALYLLPFFLLGYGLQRYHNLFQLRSTILFLVGLTLSTNILYQLHLFEQIQFLSQELLGFGIAMSGSGLLILYCPFIPLLANLGHYSYVIYIYHVLSIFTSSKILLAIAGPVSYWIHWPVIFACGIFFPIIFERSIASYKAINSIVLGKKPIISSKTHKIY